VPRLTLNISDEIVEMLNEISTKEGIAKSEAVRRALALLAIADTAKTNGHSLGIVRTEPDSSELQVIGKVLGV
jgi:metal-responsive CopG/Arc/MetJ family transcriptional regulator